MEQVGFCNAVDIMRLKLQLELQTVKTLIRLLLFGAVWSGSALFAQT